MGQPSICCVKCTSVLDRATFEGLEVDLCPQCGGLWLDRGEIDDAARLPRAELERLTGLLTGSTDTPPEPTENQVGCPACDGLLSEIVLGTVHVDFCSKCDGIFLDRGELQAAIAAVQARSRNTSPRDVIVAAASSPGTLLGA